jgi:hypothetical protein
MVEGVQRRDGRHAGNGRLLDCPFRDLGELRISGQRGERASYKDAAGTQDRRVGVPIATDAAHLRTVEQFISSDEGNPGIADLPSAAGESGGRGQYMHSVNTCRKRLPR